MFRKLFSRRTSPIVVDPSEVTPLELDDHFISLSMLFLLLADDPNIPRDELVKIVQTQFGHIDFTAWPDLDSFYAAVPLEFSEGFRAMALIAYLVLGTNVPVETIRGVLKTTFDIPGATDLPEFVAAEVRFLRIGLQ